MKLRAILIEIISFLFVGLFVYAATSKLADVEKFRIQIGQSPLLSDTAGIVAWAIPCLEIVVAVLFAWTKFRPIALYASFSLMLIFTAYIVAILTFNEQIPCACGGVLDSLGWKEHLIVNIGFVFLALGGILLQTMNSEKKTVGA